MSRKTPYIQSTDSFFHIYNRGVNRQKIFFEDDNYNFFLQRLNDYLPSSHVSIIAYRLMPNHFHLIIHQLEAEAISKYIGRVCKSYVRAINKRFDRTGHLLEGKYKMKPIGEVSYLLHLSRYIHLNPVRAKLVEKGEMWMYSSFRTFLRLESMSVTIHPQIVMQEFKNPFDYREFVESYTPNDRDKISKFLF
jgi:REP element-mobilizing transposase RayT